jgi:hypothetical protein
MNNKNGYAIFESNIYQIGREYHCTEPIIPHKSGFQFNYFPHDLIGNVMHGMVYAVIEPSGIIIKDERGIVSACSKMKIIRILTNNEIKSLYKINKYLGNLCYS